MATVIALLFLTFCDKIPRQYIRFLYFPSPFYERERNFSNILPPAYVQKFRLRRPVVYPI